MNRFALLTMALVFSACQPIAPTRLEDVQIPPDFHFETTRGTVLEIDIGPQARADASTVRIEVYKPDGGMIYRGTASAASDWKTTVRAQVAKYVDHLQVKVVRGDWEDVQDIDLPEDGRAVLQES